MFRVVPGAAKKTMPFVGEALADDAVTVADVAGLTTEVEAGRTVDKGAEVESERGAPDDPGAAEEEGGKPDDCGAPEDEVGAPDVAGCAESEAPVAEVKRPELD